MNLKVFGFILIGFFAVLTAHAQPCTVFGQTPSTAIPVCGTNVFTQTDVPNCGGTLIPTPCTDNAGYSDIRPFWYKFTCFTGGTLGFIVDPVNFNDDYDWQIFDITGRNPNEVYTNTSLFVACNWSSNPGPTGTQSTQTSLVNCAGPRFPNMSQMPTLIQGHEYLLLLSNFSQSQQGYRLSFGGGSASITDPALPKLNNAFPTCGGLKIGIKLNKKMKCASLALDGSDFVLSPANGTIVGAEGNTCSSGFDMDSVILTLSSSLSPGNYTITIRNGADGNTLLDNCDRNIAAGESLSFTILPIQPTPMDSLRTVGCEPNILELVFRNPIRCSSIAPDGSDFTVTGPSAVSVTGATGNCGANGLSRIIRIQLAGPIQVGGNYTISLRPGIDGGTIIDECGQLTPPSTLVFAASDTVSALFTPQVVLGCKIDTVHLVHDGRNGVNSWIWEANGVEVSRQQQHSIYYTQFGIKDYRLKVSNGVCSDSTTATVNLDNELKAVFNVADVLCPEDFASFTDQSIGRIQSWRWDFGNGGNSTVKNPNPQKYAAPTTTREMFYTARLIVGDNNCFDTTTKRIKVVNTCVIAVPNAFTPNNDGKNDFLYPLNAYKADNLIFRVYNRFGQLVFETKDWTKKWDGTINGRQQGTGTYAWTLQYIDRDTQQLVVKKGTTIIIR